MSVQIASELLRPILESDDPCKRIYGREKILAIYAVMEELHKHSSMIGLPSAASARALLSWHRSRDVLASTNAEFAMHAGSLALVEANWLETVTNHGTEHTEWARGICARPNHPVFELHYQWSMQEVFGSHLAQPDYAGWEWVLFPDCNMMTIANCSAHESNGVMDVIRLPHVVALTRHAIIHAAETLGHSRTYPELFTRCFGYDLDIQNAA